MTAADRAAELMKATGQTAPVGPVRLLPDPEPRARHYTFISVDDHLIEPRDMFEGRMPKALVDDAPRIVTNDSNQELWSYEGNLYANIGLNAVSGRAPEHWSMEPARFDEMRQGCWDIEARVHDMDLDGVLASLCFPSLLAGFAGTVFSESKNPELGLACVRAWNQWHLEAWAGPHPDRIIPLQITWLNDPELAADEIRKNAALGFKAVSFAENPADLKLPPIISGHWDPMLAACEETETVVCLHNASSRWSAVRSPGAPLELMTSLFSVNAVAAAADWLWSGVTWKFPKLKIAMSEGGIGWVPMLIDRIDYVMSHSASSSKAWRHPDLTPTEALRHNFWFCTIDISSSMRLRDHIGIDHITLESDYPHADSTWPNTQAMAKEGLEWLGATDEEIRKLTWENASKLFRHPVPIELQVPRVPVTV